MASAYYEKTFGTTDMVQVSKIAELILFCDNDWCRFIVEGSTISIFVINLDCIFDSCRKYCKAICVLGEIIDKVERNSEKNEIVATINTFKNILREVYGNVINNFLDVIHFVDHDVIYEQYRVESLPVRKSDMLARRLYLLDDDARRDYAKSVYSAILRFHDSKVYSDDVFALKKSVEKILRSFDTCVQVRTMADNPYKIMVRVRKPSTGILSGIKAFFGFMPAETLAEHMKEQDAIGLFKNMLISRYPRGEEFVSMLIFDYQQVYESAGIFNAQLCGETAATLKGGEGCEASRTRCRASEGIFIK